MVPLQITNQTGCFAFGCPIEHMRLHELLKGVGLTASDLPDIDITGITDDSRRAGPGILYCATRNGRRFTEDAAGAGSILVLGPSIEAPAGASVLRVPSPDRVMAHLSATLHGHPSKEMNVVAVTGTNGKTTTTHMLYHLWKKAGLPCALIGTIGLRYFDGHGEKMRQTGFTTPRSYELQAILAELLAKGIRHVTIEASSEALSLGRIEATAISGVLFTGLGRDHLDHHRTLAAYMRAKRHLFFLARRGTKPFFFAYAEDEALQSLRRFSERLGVNIQFLPEKDLYDDILYRQPVPTQFNRINAALAMRACGETAVRDLSDFAGVPGRMERIRIDDSIDAFVDYAHSPDSLERVLVETRSIGYDSIVLVFGCGGDRDPGKRPVMGAIASRLADVCIVTDDNPRREDAASIRSQILDGAVEPTKMLEIGHRAEAICAAIDRARSMASDSEHRFRRIAVIIAGKGHETYQIVGTEKMHFSDVEEIYRALQVS